MAESRVVVLLDDSRQGWRALEAAIELSVWHQTPLLALFVREEALLRRAACGFTMEYGALTGKGRRIDAVQLDARFRAQESRFRAALGEATLSHRLSCSLSVLTGDVVRETLALLQPRDLLVMGRCSAPGLLNGRLGSNSRALIRASGVPVLLWEQPRRSSGPVLLSLSGSRPERPVSAWRMQSVLDWFQASGGHDVIHRFNAGTPEQQLLRAARYAGGLLVLSQSLISDPDRLASVRLPVLVWPD
jgi:nucleotide-binding universal stress UspA family protein